MKTAYELQDEKYMLVTNATELMEIVNYLGIEDEDITGALVWVGDGDYKEVWLTESSFPYSLDAIYNVPEFYK